MPQHTIRPKRYLVEVYNYDEAPEETRTYEVRVIAADILKAEELAPTYQINSARSPIATTVLWMWAASRREGHTNLAWPEWRAKLVDWIDLARATGVEEEAVDPTRPADSTTSPSPSPPEDSAASTSTAGVERSVVSHVSLP